VADLIAPATVLGGVRCRSSRARLKYLMGEFLVFDFRPQAWICQAPFPTDAAFGLRPEDVLTTRPDGADLVIAASWPVSDLEKKVTIDSRNIRYVPAVTPRYYVSLDGSFQNYLADNFQSKTRKNIVRSVRKMQEGGAVFRVFETASDITVFLEDALAISRITYQTRMLGVGLPDTAEFRERLVAHASEGLARGYALYYEGRPVAFAYCTCNDETLYYSTIGYDPQFAALSPGTVLLYHILEHVFGEGRFRWFDFGVGEGQYKSVFGTGRGICGDVYFFRLSLRNLAIVVAHAGLDRLSGTVGAVFARFGWKSGIRKWLRRLRGAR
jgi:CelD/BcsL family acetyltransferase involved in cellulose biosynthesis